MANSALHPMSEISVRTCQAPSQLRLKPAPLPREKPPPPPEPLPRRAPPSSVTWPSYSWPAGVVPKTKPFCRSRKVSSTIWKLSESFIDESRRLSLMMMPEGSRS